MQETIICKLCLEPVTNFICVDCLLQDIHQWLLTKNQEQLYPAILHKHDTIKRTLLSSEVNKGECVICKNTSELVCPCCYLYEIHHTIKSINPDIAEEFGRAFNFDFVYHHAHAQLTLWQSLHKQLLSTRNFRPVIIIDKPHETDTNICDNCGIISENLVDVDGTWLCESCSDER
jgi:hypothetical protein